MARMSLRESDAIHDCWLRPREHAGQESELADERAIDCGMRPDFRE